jgi:excisionase family DNA binding protein
MKSLPEPHYLRELEVARRLNCSVRHVINLRQQRLIPFVRLGRRAIRYDWSAIQRALAKLSVAEH